MKTLEGKCERSRPGVRVGGRVGFRVGGRVAAVALAAAGLLAPVVRASPAEAVQAAGGAPADAAVVTQWNGIALRTIFTEAQLPPPVGQLYLGFMSAAVHDAVVAVEGRYESYLDSDHRRLGHDHAGHDHAGHDQGGHDRSGRRVSSEAAAATAAYGVLKAFFPAAAERLAADHRVSVEKTSAVNRSATAKGIRIGERAAGALIEGREGDGRNADVSLVTTPGPGVWQPTPPARAPMVAPWLGFVRPLLLDAPDRFAMPGPDELTSSAYADDFDEVRRLGSASSTLRTPAQTETARFWSDNPVRQYQDALRSLASGRALDIVESARTFAIVNTIAADALVACWRVKFDQPFWRPSTAILNAEDDGNPATTTEPGWAPLIADPAYPDYPSGHACLTGAVSNGLEHLFGADSIGFEVSSTVTGTTRRFDTAEALRESARDGRVWLGIHFRKAMDDGNDLAAKVAAWGIERYFLPLDHCDAPT